MRILLLTLLASLLFLSCDKTSSEPRVTEIILSADKHGVFTDGIDLITFKIELSDGTDITNESDLYIDDVKITGNTFSSTELGEHEVYASYQEVKSETVIIGAITKVEAPASYTTKVLVEDITGTWCGWCPRLAYKLDQAVELSSNVIPVGVHGGDIMQYEYIQQFQSQYSIEGYPTGLINRLSKWDETQGHLDNLLSNTSKLGLAISSIENGNNLDVTIKVGFAENITEATRLIVYITEDGVVADQTNYLNEVETSPWYLKGNPIVGYVHNHILREALTDIFGDIIPQYVTLERNTFSQNLSIDISAYDISNLHIVALVVEENSFGAFNVQTAAAGSSVDFD